MGKTFLWIFLLAFASQKLVKIEVTYIHLFVKDKVTVKVFMIKFFFSCAMLPHDTIRYKTLNQKIMKNSEDLDTYLVGA